VAQLTVPPFRYRPVRLRESVAEATKSLPEGNGFLRTRATAQIDITGLIDRIHEVPRQRVPQLAKELLNREIRMLLEHIPSLEEGEVLRRILEIAKLRWRPAYFKWGWHTLQDIPMSASLQTFMRFFTQIHPQSVASLCRSEEEEALLAILKSQRFMSTLAWHLMNSEKPYPQHVQDMGIQPDRGLDKEVFVQVFGQAERVVFGMAGVVFIQERMADLTMKDFLHVVNNYLNQHRLHELHSPLMHLTLSRLGPPDATGSSLWARVSDSARHKARQWHLQHQIKGFFADRDGVEEDRSRYWSAKVHLMDEVQQVSSPPTLIIFIGNTVIVEFGMKGNAIYIYERKTFRNRLERCLSAGKYSYEGTLKDKNIALGRISHQSGWQYKCDRILRQLSR